MADRRKPQAWLQELSLTEALLVHLASAQSRFESAIVARFRNDHGERDVRGALRELHSNGCIDLDAIDRVRWRISVRGVNKAADARARAKKARAA